MGVVRAYRCFLWRVYSHYRDLPIGKSPYVSALFVAVLEWLTVLLASDLVWPDHPFGWLSLNSLAALAALVVVHWLIFQSQSILIRLEADFEPEPASSQAYNRTVLLACVVPAALLLAHAA